MKRPYNIIDTRIKKGDRVVFKVRILRQLPQLTGRIGTVKRVAEINFIVQFDGENCITKVSKHMLKYSKG